MMNDWEIWLSQTPEFSFAGKDSDGEYDAENFDNYEDDAEDQNDSGSGTISDGDGGDGDDDGADDTARRVRRLENDNKKLSRELEAAIELLNKAAENEGSGEDAPEGFVPQDDYDALIDLLRTDYVEHAIANFRKKDGSPRWDWEDPTAVYKFLDIDELEIDVKSKVIDGLEDQLADIAERYPFMLKNANRRREGGSGLTGKPPRKSGARERISNPSIEALVAEFPALVD